VTDGIAHDRESHPFNNRGHLQYFRRGADTIEGMAVDVAAFIKGWDLRKLISIEGDGRA